MKGKDNIIMGFVDVFGSRLLNNIYFLFIID